MYEELIKELKLLATTSQMPPYPGIGLCYNFNYPVEVPQELLKKSLKTWPLFTGNYAYPVPHPSKPPRDAYSIHDKWNINTDYGKARRNLCGHFATYLENITCTHSDGSGQE